MNLKWINKVPVYTCKRCNEDVTTRMMSPSRINDEIWQHFFNFHSEDLDARRVFHTYLESDGSNQSHDSDVDW